MGNYHNSTVQQSQCDEALFGIKAVIDNSNSPAVKYLLYPDEINSVFPNVGLSLSLIPLESHLSIVVTVCSYVKRMGKPAIWADRIVATLDEAPAQPGVADMQAELATDTEVFLACCQRGC